MENEVEEIEVKKEIKEIVKPKPMKANENGLMLGSTLEERFRVCSLYVASGMLPKSYNTPEKAFIGIQYALELGFKDQPLTALKNIAVINGMPSIWGELPLALAMKSGLLEHIDEYFVDKNNKRLDSTCTAEQVFAAVCVVKRNGITFERAYTQNDKTKLGVQAIWNQFEKIMMKRKARAVALKDAFPDVLLGITVGEYEYHKHESEINDGDMIETTAETVKANELTDKFKDEIPE